MSSAHPKPITISGDAGLRVSGLLQTPPGARACYVLAHGAGAGMDHPFMAAVAAELAPRGIATLRYQFPAMERGARRPDPPQVAQATSAPPPPRHCGFFRACRSLPAASP